MPNVGTAFVKVDATTWDGTTTPMVKTATGWVKIYRMYKKINSTTWSVIYERDTKPPAAPVSLTAAMSTTTPTLLVITAKAPADADQSKLVYRWSTSAYATSITGGMGGTTVNAGPNVTVATTWPNQKSGTVYYWAVFAVDSSGNASAPKLLKYTVPKIVTTPPPVTKTAYFYATDSGSWNSQSSYWRTDNNYVYQGGYDWHGLWFYSTRISGGLANATRINLMQIAITRANTVHGVSGPANVYLTAHTLATQPAGSPASADTAGVYIGTLGRGETKTFTVPSTYYAGFLSGAYKGFGLYIGATSFTDVRYLYALGGSGATSGRVYVSWVE